MTSPKVAPDRQNIFQYALVTAAYWGFTLTDGALRMLVLLHFHSLGYTPLQLASLFLLYEIFGIVTNITGGWLGSRVGLNRTLTLGLGLQIVALTCLTLLQDSWPLAIAVPFVVAVQGLSGIAKDLTKMSAKSALKLIVPADQNARLFKWVALLTGSKNTLKGIGFFFGGLLLSLMGFVPALWTMTALLTLILVPALLYLAPGMGQIKKKVTLTEIFSKSPSINLLSIARFFLFGARDVWFVVALPLFLYEGLGWSFAEVGAVMALWVIGYGLVQSAAPLILRKSADGRSREVMENRLWICLLTTLPFLMLGGLKMNISPALVLLTGFGVFGVVFAVNSALHSYLILALTREKDVALNVGFYYSANAGGRLLGTLLSGSLYQAGGLPACLLGSGIMLAAATVFSMLLPRRGDD